MDGKIEKDDMLHPIEFGSRDPVVIPVNGHLHALHISDQAKGNRPPHKTEMRCPATILIHRKFALLCIGNRNQTFALRKIEDERFLAQYMFACPKGRFG